MLEAMQPDDCKSTLADFTLADKVLGFNPKVTIEAGKTKFVEWYRQYSIQN